MTDDRRAGATGFWVPASVLTARPGWRVVDTAADAKLRSSVSRFGQVRPLIVRAVNDRLQVVEGRQLLRVLQAMGARAWVLQVEVDDLEADRLCLACDLYRQTDFAVLSQRVKRLVAAGATPDEVALTSPFDGQRVRYIAQLADFDWSQFAEKAPSLWQSDDVALAPLETRQPDQASDESDAKGTDVAGAEAPPGDRSDMLW